MFLFFVGGVNQKIKKVIQQGYGPCVSCRTGTMDLVEMANTLSVFFVPVWDFNKQTALVCRRCNFACPVSDYKALQEDNAAQPFPVSASIYGHPKAQSSCPHCGSPISNQWKFCPTCGVAADYQGK
jgi:predicted molibdopterin-dependent oxidoreductase YjgC